MANILADIGRSDLTQSVGTLVNYYRSKRQEQQNNVLFNEQLQNTRIDRNIKEMQLEELRANRQKIGVDQIKQQIPYGFDFLKRNAQAMGLIDKDGFMTVGDMKGFYQNFLSKPENNKAFGKNALKDAQQKLDMLQSIPTAENGKEIMAQFGIKSEKDLPAVVQKIQGDINSLKTSIDDFDENLKLWNSYPDDVQVFLTQNGVTPGLDSVTFQDKVQDVLKQYKETQNPFENVSDNELIAMAQDTGNPNSAKAQSILDAKEKAQIARAKATGEARGEGYAKSRVTSVFDTETGEIKQVPVDIVGKDQRENPDEPRYLTGTAAEKAAKQLNLIKDIQVNIDATRGSINNLKTNFDSKTRTKLYLAMKANHPETALGNLIYGKFGEKLTPDQIDYVTDMLVLVENAMAMRSVLGAGQGSDELRAAIKATVPSEGTFSKEYANAQLDKFTRTLDNLTRGIPGGKRISETLFGDKSESKQAPPEAIEFLKNNPHLKDQFKAKYGYIPEGF